MLLYEWFRRDYSMLCKRLQDQRHSACWWLQISWEIHSVSGTALTYLSEAAHVLILLTVLTGTGGSGSITTMCCLLSIFALLSVWSQRQDTYFQTLVVRCGAIRRTAVFMQLLWCCVVVVLLFTHWCMHLFPVVAGETSISCIWT